MKKLFVVGIIVLFLGLAIVPSTANSTREIDVKLEGRIGVIITISNIGNETINFSSWRISVKGGHFELINKSIKGNITLFEPNDKIVRRILVFGFGFITIGFWVYIPPSKPGHPHYYLHGWEDMFVFGPYVYQRP